MLWKTFSKYDNNDNNLIPCASRFIIVIFISYNGKIHIHSFSFFDIIISRAIFTVRFIEFQNNSLKDVYIESICIKNFLVNFQFSKKFKVYAYARIKFTYNYFCQRRKEEYFATKRNIAYILITKKFDIM